MKVMISGSHGLIGNALTSRLISDGNEVIRLGRVFSESIDFTGVDAVIHLAGENIAGGRWTSRRKAAIRDSRINGTQALSLQLSSSANRPEVFISASAIGYYGDRGDEKLTETSTAGCGFLADVCSEWEMAAESASQSGIRTALIRTGIVLSSEGGALKKMLPPFKIGAGGIMGNGRQYMSWISIEDMVGAIIHILNTPTVQGPVNLTAPEPETNRRFTRILGNVLKRPTILPLPAFAARLLFGEMANALLLSSTRVIPNVLLENNYHFKHPDLKSALKAVLK
ncbi:TIGR01777 family protein [Verrucomicrobia bacterium S94]|nr:TIGR01777 family protein [Verrucomicrobia bacterium S94]